MAPAVPLSVLDLVPVTTGSTTGEAVRNAIDLARQTESLGYKRYWFAEHHLNPGVAGTTPPLLIGLVASATSRIRVGSGGMQMGHRTPLSVVEEFGLLDAVHPGRLDLGLGRSGGRNFKPAGASPEREPVPERELVKVGKEKDGYAASNGLVIPPRFSFERLLGSPRFALNKQLLQQPGAETPDYGDQVREILALLDGSYRSPEGLGAPVVPGRGADVEVWVLGSSAGDSAAAAGELGLPFAANYHVSPATVLEATNAYRAAFRPSAKLARPYVIVSADVVVADDDATARDLAAGYPNWVLSIRTGAGAIEFPTKTEAQAHEWTEDERALVKDRVDTQFVGSPATVAQRLDQLQEATAADELLVTTITHQHADRVRSYALLAEVWAG
jgi:alkanesulfonate monooxygenase SsuD/methylene tetrahydromethanopterin reductase-like flavin-dependent oxidoreductase (luciferase family)